MRKITVLILFSSFGFLFPESALAYIGPGAGFAFLGSTFVFVLTIGMALLTISLWPLRWTIKKISKKGISKNARAKRVVIIGLDGLEPKLVDKYIAEGKLPNLEQLSIAGSFDRLGTTLPALSPVAWSSFQTGVNPGAHNIFDFLTRDKRFCLPQLASTETNITKKVINLLGFKIKKEKAEVKITRKSQPFWKILGNNGVFSNVIRVPISYPPEKFNGNVLSAMCTPDLKGTQGSFSFFSTKKNTTDKTTGGEVGQLVREGNILKGGVDGPPRSDGKGFIKAPFELTLDLNKKEATIKISKETETLKLNELSRWLEVEFLFGKKIVSGICRVCLREIGSEVSIYFSPMNIHPEKPVLPIAHPIYFSTWLAKRNGLYGTLGLMEDTWGRNEMAIDDQRFLDQTYSIHDEREKMLNDALDRTNEGVCICVFDASDRIQHMFWRYLDDKHLSPLEDASFINTIPKMYEKMDQLIGKVQAKLNKDDLLVILSDHGFSSFRRCINLNTWLLKEGYLVVKEGGPTGADYFKDVDWSRTKAFAVGLSGLYINKKGRESYGIVEEAEAQKLKAEIISKLTGIKDPQDGSVAIRNVYDTAKEYRGLYTSEAPDLIIGYNPGYRVSWDSITGGIEKDVFSDNLKAWSGDHHIDPELVPGILFTNRKLKTKNPHIVDIAPTILDVFDIKIPVYMEGKVLL
ncbi:MAG: alkaline phosphatase family protein [bacterium]|nr:alkaline phosphatase family protein [bacterium]